MTKIGWDGIECPIRKVGVTHIKPEEAETRLPEMVEALAEQRKVVGMVSTSITSVDSESERLLRIIAANGITHYRIGFAHYPWNEKITETVARFTSQMKDLSELNAELGLTGGYQNHSGKNYIGGPIWDFWMMIKDLDPASIGFSFDIGQAMIEGGLSWPTQARLTRDRWVALQVKDFNWTRDKKNQWKPQWCPLGKGRLQQQFFDDFKSSSFDGPIIQHCEHIRPGGPVDATITGLSNDFQTLKKWLT